MEPFPSLGSQRCSQVTIWGGAFVLVARDFTTEVPRNGDEIMNLLLCVFVSPW